MQRVSAQGVLLRAAVLMLAAFSGACAAPRPAEELHAPWPPPPAAPRITHVRTIRGAAELARPAFFQKVAHLVTGSSRQALLRPHGVAVQGDDRLFVTDQEQQVAHSLGLDGTASSVIDRAGKTFFVSPVGVAFCDGVLAVSDSSLKSVYLLKPDGELVGTLQKPGGFQRPTGLAYDPQQKLLYVVDTLANEVCVFELTGGLVRRFGAPGTDIGQFSYPTHVFADGRGKIYVTDSLNFRVQAFDPSGKYLFDIGRHGDATGHLGMPKGVAADSDGHVYVADSYFSVVQVFNPDGRFLLSFGEPGQGPGAFQVPAGLTIDAKNRIYVCDSYNSRVQVFQYVGEENESAASQK